MGMITTSVLFADSSITIAPHTVSVPYTRFLYNTCSLSQFAGSDRVSVSKIDGTSEYIFRKSNGDFITGPEV